VSRRLPAARRNADRRGLDLLDNALYWRGWMAQLGRSFDFESQDGGADWNNILRDVADLGEKRRFIVDRLVACGLNRAALESLKEGSDDPKIVLAFV